MNTKRKYLADLYPENSENSSLLSGGNVNFSSAKRVRDKARLAGMNPNYWYPAEWSSKVDIGGHCRAKFWSQSIALFRSSDGSINAVEDRCAHRHLPLTMGKVVKDKIVCAYHGWSFDGGGDIQSVEHDLFGCNLPKVKIRNYPVKEKYGLIWIFPGDPELSEKIPLPVIPNAEGTGSWLNFSFDFSWSAHFSMVIDNLCNLTHLYVHGDWAPYEKTWMVHHDLKEEKLELVWNHTLKKRMTYPIFKHFLLKDKSKNLTDTNSVYDYPYHVALNNESFRTVNLMLPLSECETRVFTIQYWKDLALPFFPKSINRLITKYIFLPLVKPTTVEVYRQDGATVESEMINLPANFDKPIPEINKAVQLFDQLNVNQWKKWVDYVNGSLELESINQNEKVLLKSPIDT